MFKSCQVFCRIVSPNFRAFSSPSNPQLKTLTPLELLNKRSQVHKMGKVYLRLVESEARLSLNFRYSNPGLNVDRWFNLNRSIEEPLSDLASRISNNLEKVLAKKSDRRKKKNQPNVPAQDCKLEVTFMKDNLPIALDSASKVLAQHPCSIQIGEITYEIDVNPPTVKNVQLPSCIMAEFPVYPRKIDFEFCLPEESQFVWYTLPSSALPVSEKNTSTSASNVDPQIPEDSDQWERISEGFYFVPTNDLVDHYLKLKCIPKTGDRIGLPSVAISTIPVTAGPGVCPFDTRHAFTTARMNEEGFRVMSYNILADLYADSDFSRTVLFPYCPRYALAIDYRKQLFLKEIIGYHADIVCLQEVDSKIFDYDLQPLLGSLNYDSVFHVKGGTVAEGLACIFNKKKFRLVESSSRVLGEEIKSNALFADILEALQRNEALFNRVTARTTSALVCVLESVEHPGRRIVVGNTHLYFHPNADHVRLVQATAAIRLVREMVTKHQALSSDVRLLFCGDFNSCPEYAVYELFTQQFIPVEHSDWNSCPEEAVKGLTVTQPFKLFSACGTPPFTNYVGGFVGCLDYIFCEEEKFQVEQVVPLPSLEEVQEHTALPSVVFPSDHVALVADLSWK